jgi:hypothetical protein
MNDPALFDQIIIRLRTKSEVTQLLVCLEECSDKLFSSGSQNDPQQAFRELPKAVADILIVTFASEPVTPEKKVILKRQLDELSDKLRKCKSIQLTIAFQPNEDAIALFSDWIKKNVRPDLLLDLQYDKSIVGGALLISEGVFKDYSVKKNLINRFRIQREDIMGLLS